MSLTAYIKHHYLMFNRITDVSGTIGVISLNVYTIIEYIKSSTPVLLAIGSITLTVAMIIVQIHKKRLVDKQLEQQNLECQKTALEIEELKKRAQNDLSDN